MHCTQLNMFRQEIAASGNPQRNQTNPSVSYATKNHKCWCHYVVCFKYGLVHMYRVVDWLEHSACNADSTGSNLTRGSYRIGPLRYFTSLTIAQSHRRGIFKNLGTYKSNSKTESCIFNSTKGILHLYKLTSTARLVITSCHQMKSTINILNCFGGH